MRPAPAAYGVWACRARGLSRRRRAAASGAIAVPQRSSVCGKRTGGCVRRARACCTLVCGCVRMRACASALHRSATLGVASAGASAPADDPRKVPMESAGPPALLQRMPLRKRVRKEHRHPRTRPARLNSSLAALRSMTSASRKFSRSVTSQTVTSAHELKNSTNKRSFVLDL